MSSNIETEILRMLADERAIPQKKLSLECRFAEDLGMDGDDAVEFFEAYSRSFEVDLSDMQWDRHFGPEGCNPFVLLMPSFWREKKCLIPVTISDLIAAAEFGKWVFEYPSDTPTN